MKCLGWKEGCWSIGSLKSHNVAVQCLVEIKITWIILGIITFNIEFNLALHYMDTISHII